MGLRRFANPAFYERIRGGTAIWPGASWDGTSGSGGSAPTPSPVAYGSVFSQQTIGNFDRPAEVYLTADLQLTVLCDIADAQWINYVEFSVEGRTRRIYVSSLSSDGVSIGFSCTLSYADFPQDGDAAVYARIVPFNGYDRVVGPLNVHRMQDASRPIRYIDPAGSDANDGLTSGTAWKSVVKALQAAPSGAIVSCATGTYFEDSNGSANNTVARPIELRPASGNYGDVVIDRTSRYMPDYHWIIRATNVIFNKIRIELSNICQVYDGLNGSTFILQDGAFTDRNGPLGPTLGLFHDAPPGGIGADWQQDKLRESGGSYWALVNSSMTTDMCTGWSFLRNVTLSSGGDLVSFNTPTSRGITAIKVVATKAGEAYIRYNWLTLTVASANYDAGTNRTILTWSGSPLITALGAGQSDPTLQARFLTGALTGQGAQVYSQDATGFTTTVIGNWAPAAGDTAWVSLIVHADTSQCGIRPQTGINYDNNIFQRCKFSGDYYQPMFLQSGHYGGSGTVSTTGVNGTTSVANSLQVGDFVVLNGGSQKWQARRVAATPTNTTFTLAYAFTVDQSNTAWNQAKSINNTAWQLCIWAWTDGTFRSPHTEQTQWQDGHRHLIMRQCTQPPTPVTFRTQGGGFGAEDCYVLDSIIYGIGGDSGSLPSSGVLGVNYDHVHFINAPSSGTASAVGAATFDANYNPTSGVTLLASQKKIPFNYAGAPLTGASLVGAMG